jgi:hypothetical protein
MPVRLRLSQICLGDSTRREGTQRLCTNASLVTPFIVNTRWELYAVAGVCA